MKLAHALPRTCGGVPAECAARYGRNGIAGLCSRSHRRSGILPAPGMRSKYGVHIWQSGSRPAGAFCLATGQISPARAASSLCGLKWNTALASGHRGQRWGKVEGRRFSAPPFSHFPTGQREAEKHIHPSFHIGGFSDDGNKAAYHKEVKTASFQGKSITVENLTPVLSPRRGTSASGNRELSL